MAKERLLLHCCCAPCTCAILEYLKDYYDITLFFYNPNITDEREYSKRFAEVKFMLNKMQLQEEVKLVDGGFDPELFEKFAPNLSIEHEGGRRCIACYGCRLNQTATYATHNGFNQFSTTLTLSPYKDSAVVNNIGTSAAAAFSNVMYMPFDFSFLYIRSRQLSDELGLYQQDYCGCKYSRK